MSKYFLTGGTGVIGSAIAERLLADGDHVTLLIRARSDVDHRPQERSLRRGLRPSEYRL